MSHVTNGTGVQQQSFETLEAVLNKLHPNCGINVEIKYPQLKQVRTTDLVQFNTVSLL